ncbi:hypothetical protein MBLNU230_g4336t1 [Neophaeotheca triangularis]
MTNQIQDHPVAQANKERKEAPTRPPTHAPTAPSAAPTAFDEEETVPLWRFLSHELIAELSLLPEPTRTKTWATICYHTDPETQTSQTRLWKTYKTTFSNPHQDQPQPQNPHLDFRPFIHLLTKIFPTTSLQITPMGKFTIQGLAPRRLPISHFPPDYETTRFEATIGRAMALLQRKHVPSSAAEIVRLVAGVLGVGDQEGPRVGPGEEEYRGTVGVLAELVSGSRCEVGKVLGELGRRVGVDCLRADVVYEMRRRGEVGGRVAGLAGLAGGITEKGRQEARGWGVGEKREGSGETALGPVDGMDRGVDGEGRAKRQKVSLGRRVGCRE